MAEERRLGEEEGSETKKTWQQKIARGFGGPVSSPPGPGPPQHCRTPHRDGRGDGCPPAPATTPPAPAVRGRTGQPTHHQPNSWPESCSYSESQFSTPFL